METYAVRVSNEDRAHKGAGLRQASSALISGALQQGLQVRCEGLTALMEWYAEHWRAAGGPSAPGGQGRLGQQRHRQQHKSRHQQQKVKHR